MPHFSRATWLPLAHRRGKSAWGQWLRQKLLELFVDTPRACLYKISRSTTLTFWVVANLFFEPVLISSCEDRE